MKNISYNKIQLSPAATCLFNAYGAMGLMPMGKPIVGKSKSLLAVMSGRDYNGKRMSPVVVDLTQKLDKKVSREYTADTSLANVLESVALPESINKEIGVGITFFREGHFEQATEIFDLALSKSPYSESYFSKMRSLGYVLDNEAKQEQSKTLM